jgi:hypothetical protein
MAPDMTTCRASSRIRVCSTPGADRSLSTSLRNGEFPSLRVLIRELEGLRLASAYLLTVFWTNGRAGHQPFFPGLHSIHTILLMLVAILALRLCIVASQLVCVSHVARPWRGARTFLWRQKSQATSTRCFRLWFVGGHAAEKRK